MNEYSFIVEFDEINDIQIDELWKYLLDKNIKFHVLKANDDYLKEEKYKEKYNKALQLLTEYNLPCEIDNFNTKEDNLDYCSRNCSVDEKTYIKCWDRFIE